MDIEDKQRITVRETSACERLADSRRQGKSLFEFGLAELVRLGRFLKFLAPLPWLWISTLAKGKKENRNRNGN